MSRAVLMGPIIGEPANRGKCARANTRLWAWPRCYDRSAAMPFIPPMLATRPEDPRRLADPRYSAEPKLDGQRAQLHVRDYRTVHSFSRHGRELITLPGLAWLRELRWPVASAVLDGEAVAGDGSEGIQAVFEARTRPRSRATNCRECRQHREGRAAQEESSHYGRSDVPAPRTSSNRRSLF